MKLDRPLFSSDKACTAFNPVYRDVTGVTINKAIASQLSSYSNIISKTEYALIKAGCQEQFILKSPINSHRDLTSEIGKCHE